MFRSLYFIPLLFFGCSGSNQYNANIQQGHNQRAITIYGDTSFSPEEQHKIISGTIKIREATRGFLSIVVDFSYDWNNAESIIIHRNDDSILRVCSKLPFIEKLERNLEGAHTHGLTRQHSIPKKIYLVYDRIPEPNFERDSMHELLHMVGLSDLNERGNLMSVESNTITCFTKADANEFCDVFDCDSSNIKLCKGN